MIGLLLIDEVHGARVAASSVVPSPILNRGSPLATELETRCLSGRGSLERGEAPNDGGRGGVEGANSGRGSEALINCSLIGSLLVEVLHDLLENSLATKSINTISVTYTLLPQRKVSIWCWVKARTLGGSPGGEVGIGGVASKLSSLKGRGTNVIPKASHTRSVV